MTGSPFKDEQKAVIDAVLNLFGASSTADFMLPIPNTTPTVYIAAGEPGQIRALTDGWNTGDRLCEYKAKDIANRGYKHCGYVLRNDQDEYCVINNAAVRWLSNEECWALMHPDSKSAKENSESSPKSDDLVKALRALADGDYRTIAHADQCVHGRYGYEACETCAQEYAGEALAQYEAKANSNNENLVADFEFMQQVLDNDKGEPSRYAGTGEDDGEPQ
jgi:hypothetical protein